MPTSYMSWLSSFPFVGRTSHAPQRSDCSDSSTATLPNPALPLSPSKEKDNIWDEGKGAGEESVKFSGPMPYPLFDHAALEDSPPLSPAASDPSSDDDDLDTFVSIQHSHPISHPMSLGAPLHFVFDERNSSFDPEEAGSSNSGLQDEIPNSPTPSLVPTIIASRPPSPSPDPCVKAAEALGIKVRDFAYEQHCVPLARPVPDVETLKARYQLYRSADLTPPADVVETLSNYDPMWLEEKKKFFDEREQGSPSKPPECVPWRHTRGMVWCGSPGRESVAMAADGPEDSRYVEDSVSDVIAGLASLTVKPSCEVSSEIID